MTPLMSLFLRCLVALLLIVILFSLADYSMAATLVPGPAPDALQASGRPAGHIAHLWNVFLGACAIVFAGIVAAMLYAAWKAPGSARESPRTRGAASFVIASSLALAALVVAGVFTDRALARMSLENAVNIEVTAHQGSWTARYVDGGPSNAFVSANEMHVPVGRPVVVTLKADDAIRSLWLPGLAGRKDLIPGRIGVMRFQAGKAGVYRGRCADACGPRHEMPDLLVIAERPDRYEAWFQAQQAPGLTRVADARGSA